ncbi:hypothetical protein ACFBZI_09335 [Moraxella sp. ZJ142]|uniref:hypothetical protein n=1 Tax=Moraxella marmotae TaxID=3344520 RepID=UPI0035D408DE
MPKIVANPKTRSQIQAESDARRGVKTASYKFPIEFINHLAELSKKTGLPRSRIIMMAVRSWKYDTP